MDNENIHICMELDLFLLKKITNYLISGHKATGSHWE